MSINISEFEATLPHDNLSRYPLPLNAPKQGKKGLQALVGKKKLSQLKVFVFWQRNKKNYFDTCHQTYSRNNFHNFSFSCLKVTNVRTLSCKLKYKILAINYYWLF